MKGLFRKFLTADRQLKSPMKGLAQTSSFRRRALGEPHEGALSKIVHLPLQESLASRRWKARGIYFRRKGPTESFILCWNSSLPCLAFYSRGNPFAESAWRKIPSSLPSLSAFISRSPSSSLPTRRDRHASRRNQLRRERHSFPLS